MRIVVCGTYDLGKPRTRILIDGLSAAGVEVLQVHAEVWRGVEDKSQVRHFGRLARLVRWISAYPGLLVRYLRMPPHDAVLIPYLGQFDVLLLAPLARLRGIPVVWDMFISLYDTTVHDRRLVPPGGYRAGILKALERLACNLSDRVLIDTRPHARHIETILSLPHGTIGWVPVGAEPAEFPRLPPPATHTKPPRILFYGQLIPLHGVQTILEAAASAGGRNYHWELIGSGQDEPRVRSFLSSNPMAHVDWKPWIPYEDLKRRIEAADICLGIFGGSDKAASVVPNKVYQALFCGRSIITRDSPAIRELVPAHTPGIRLVPPGDPDALVEAVSRLERDGFPQPPSSLRRALSPTAIGQRLEAELAAVTRTAPGLGELSA